MNKYCKESEMLSAYLDGELDGKSRLRFEGHLAGCCDCQHLLNDLQSLQTCFSALPREKVGFDLAHAVLAAPKRKAATAWLPRVSLWHVLPTAVAAAATLVLGIFLGTSLVGRPDAGPTAPTLAMFDPIPPGSVCVGFAGCYRGKEI